MHYPPRAFGETEIFNRFFFRKSTLSGHKLIKTFKWTDTAIRSPGKQKKCFIAFVDQKHLGFLALLGKPLNRGCRGGNLEGVGGSGPLLKFRMSFPGGSGGSPA